MNIKVGFQIDTVTLWLANQSATIWKPLSDLTFKFSDFSDNPFFQIKFLHNFFVILQILKFWWQIDVAWNERNISEIFFILDRHEPINGFSSREQVYNPVSKVHHTSA